MKISIITPSFRPGSWLRQCISSVADQVGGEIEHLVQDAGSDDGTLEWLPHDPRVRSFIEKDDGMYDAINRALARSDGEVCAWLNCDEQYLPSALARVERFFTEYPETDVLFGGNLSEQKGLGDALSAFARVAPLNWTLHVIGSGTSAAETALPSRVKELGISDRFMHQRNVGPEEIAEAMRNSSVFLLPTRIDTGPTALKEALAMGLWPVCYDNSGPGEYIRQFRFGSLARNLDHQDLCHQLSEALHTRPWLAPTRRVELLQRTRRRFSKCEIWPQLYKVYNEIIRDSR